MIYKQFKDEKWELPFIYSLPENISKDKKYPLIVFLHGAGQRGNDLLHVCDIGLPKYILCREDVEAILLVPQCDKNSVWKMLIKDLYVLINKFIQTFPVDSKGISLCGISMGAYGSFDFAMTYPDMVKKMVCICGAGDCWRAERLKNIPTRIFHGDNDPLVPVTNSIEIYEAIKKEGGDVELTIFHDVGHDSWSRALESTKIVDWLVK